MSRRVQCSLGSVGATNSFRVYCKTPFWTLGTLISRGCIDTGPGSVSSSRPTAYRPTVSQHLENARGESRLRSDVRDKLHMGHCSPKPNSHSCGCRSTCSGTCRILQTWRWECEEKNAKKNINMIKARTKEKKKMIKLVGLVLVKIGSIDLSVRCGSSDLTASRRARHEV